MVEPAQRNGGPLGVIARVAAPERELEPADPLPNLDDAPDGVLDCVVVGAGISGLVTAQALLRDHKGQVSR